MKPSSPLFLPRPLASYPDILGCTYIGGSHGPFLDRPLSIYIAFIGF